MFVFNIKAVKVDREAAVKACNKSVLDDDIATAVNLNVLNLDPIMKMCVDDYMVCMW